MLVLESETAEHGMNDLSSRGRFRPAAMLERLFRRASVISGSLPGRRGPRRANGRASQANLAGRGPLLASQLFDVAFYAAQAGLQPDLERCVDHYIEVGATAGYSANRLFDGAAYLAHHPDVADAGVDPFVHFVMHGIGEGRQNTVPEACLEHVRSMTPDALALRRVSAQARALGWTQGRPSPWATKSVAVYASSLGNFFFRHIADRIAEGLQYGCARVYRLDQNSARPPEIDVDLFVAPHEFFHLGGGRTWRGRPEVVRSLMLNTEQPGTHWYFLALSYAGPAVTLVDLSPQSAVLLHDLGRTCSGYLPLGVVPQVLPPAGRGGASVTPVRGLESLVGPWGASSADGTSSWRTRPIDVLFLGTLTPRRSKALARLAPALARYRCFIHAPTGSGKPLAGGRTDLGIQESLLLARNARIVLNIHRDEFPYFEWHRVMMIGVEQGAVVLSEPCLPSPGVEPGRHFMAATLDEMPDMLGRLLGTCEGDQWATQVEELRTRALLQEFDLRTELGAVAYLHETGFYHA